MPVRLAFGPVLVHRRCRLSALAPQCVETATPGHHWDEPGGTARKEEPDQSLRPTLARMPEGATGGGPGLQAL